MHARPASEIIARSAGHDALSVATRSGASLLSARALGWRARVHRRTLSASPLKAQRPLVQAYPEQAPPSPAALRTGHKSAVRRRWAR